MFFIILVNKFENFIELLDFTNNIFCSKIELKDCLHYIIHGNEIVTISLGIARLSITPVPG
jgi:hypothetical protein